MSLTRKILLALFFIGFAGNVGGGAGTFASFNASTTNALSSFASGSIVLSNANQSSGSNKVCFSNANVDDGAGTSTDDNANDACETLFPVAVNQPGDSATVDLNLKNEGSLAGTLTLFAAPHVPPGGVTPQTACSNTATGTYSGTGVDGGVDFCEKLQLRVQRFSADSRNPSTELHSCVYGQDTTPNDDACDEGVAGAEGFNLEHFTVTSAAATTGISLGQLDELDGTADTAFISITVEFPDGGAGADNAYQGRVASFAITWQLDQL